MKALVIAVAVSLTFAAVHPAAAQDVVASYANDRGSIIRYRVADGVPIATTEVVYRVGYSPFYPMRIAIDGTYYYVLFGNRYIAQVRPSDGKILWVVDASIQVGVVRYWPLDLAVANGAVFVCTGDPAGRIVKYRASDGALQWTIVAGTPVGSITYTPYRIASAGTDSIYVMIGGMFLTRIRQSTGAVVWQKSIPLTYALATWGAADIAVSGGFVYVVNVDPNGIMRKFSAADGSLVWSLMPSYQLGAVKYLPRTLAASGADSILTLFGNRYLARLRTSDASRYWVKDAGLTSGAFTFAPTDIATVPAP